MRRPVKAIALFVLAALLPAATPAAAQYRQEVPAVFKQVAQAETAPAYGTVGGAPAPKKPAQPVTPAPAYTPHPATPDALLPKAQDAAAPTTANTAPAPGGIEHDPAKVDPCAAYMGSYDSYAICQDRMMKLQRMQEAKQRRIESMKSPKQKAAEKAAAEKAAAEKLAGDQAAAAAAAAEAATAAAAEAATAAEAAGAAPPLEDGVKKMKKGF